MVKMSSFMLFMFYHNKMGNYASIEKLEPGLMEWLKWLSSCLACVRPGVQTPILPEKNRTSGIARASCL
jgi:hypothetical protein